jgi:hypothetical protein
MIEWTMLSTLYLTAVAEWAGVVVRGLVAGPDRLAHNRREEKR